MPGCREAIIPFKTGLLVAPRNSEDLAEKIEWLINRPEEIKKMSKLARDFAEKNFKESHINEEHLMCYEKILFR